MRKPDRKTHTRPASRLRTLSQMSASGATDEDGSLTTSRGF